MTFQRLRRTLSALLLALAGLGLAPEAMADGKPYNESAHPADDLMAALKLAREANKHVLLVFGANWCTDCRKLDVDLKTGPLATLMERDFIVVKVDVGRFDKNLDFVNLYPKVIAKGIPSIAVVTARNEIVHVAQGGELADARHMNAEQVGKYFEDLSRKTVGH
jgi:protein disulfide-isomerase